MASINPKALSEAEIRQQLLDIVASQPDSQKWQDFFAGGHGTTLMEWLTAIGTFTNYQAVAYRRESNAITGKLKSTIYASAYLFGYPVNRKLSAKLTLVINNTGNKVFWQRVNPIGYFNGSPVSLIKDQTIEHGLNTVTVLLGEWMNATTTVTENTEFYTYSIPLDVDMEYVCNENVYLTINDKPQTLGRYVEELEDDKIILKTSINTIDIMFGGTSIGIPAVLGDELRVDWLQIKESSSTTDAFRFDLSTFQGVDGIILQSLTVQRREKAEDSLRKIALISPGYFASKRRMVTPDDHEAIVMSYPGIASAKFAMGICTNNPVFNWNKATCESDKTGGKPGVWEDAATGCCTHVMSYLQDDETPMTLSEEDLLLAYLEGHQIAGEQIIFRQGQPVAVRPKIYALIEKDFTDVEALTKSINDIIASQCYILQGTFKVGLMVTQINALYGMQYCYVARPTRDMRLSWLGYFRPEDVDITFFTDEEEMHQFGLSTDDTTIGYELMPTPGLNGDLNALTLNPITVGATQVVGIGHPGAEYTLEQADGNPISVKATADEATGDVTWDLTVGVGEIKITGRLTDYTDSITKVIPTPAP